MTGQAKKMNLNSILSAVGLGGNLSQNVSLIVILALLSLVLGLVAGRQRLIPILLGAYISIVIVNNLPGEFFSDTSYKLILFLALIALFAISGQRFLSGSLAFGSKFWKLIFFSFLEIMLILSFVFSIIPKTTALGYVSSSAYGYFVSEWFSFIWLIFPLLFLLLFCRRGSAW